MRISDWSSDVCSSDLPAAGGQSAAPLHLIEKVVCGFAATILFCLMVCTFVDVVGRYVFNSPLPGALELTEIMMASLIFTILPVVSARSDHITVDLLVLPRSSMLRRIQNLAINVTSAIMLAVLAWQLWLHAADMYSYKIGRAHV